MEKIQLPIQTALTTDIFFPLNFFWRFSFLVMWKGDEGRKGIWGIAKLFHEIRH